MTATHHPGVENLMSCSAGSQPEAFAAIMATHISMCPQCRRELALMEKIGTALFDQIAPVDIDRPAPVAALRSLEADALNAPRRVNAVADDVPATLSPVIGPSFDRIPWSRLGPGLWQHRIALTNDERGELRLFKVAPGQRLPEHGHSGTELTLVLRGAFCDATGSYHPGDVADLDETITHQPIADAKEGCICLTATLGKLAFKSPLVRLVQPLIGL